MTPPRIKAVTISYATEMFEMDFLNGSARADLVFNDGSTDTFSWYREEVSFTEDDFLNHTMDEVLKTFIQRDMAWLRS
jgi:hypothetical protein